MTLATQDAVEGVALPTKMEALQVVESAIQDNATGNKGHASFWERIIWITDNKAWLSLDFDSLDSLWDARFSHLEVVVPRAIRQGVVESMDRAGQTQQQIAKKLGVSLGTVNGAIFKIENRSGVRINARGEERPLNYATKPAPIAPDPEIIPAEMEEDMPATLAHKTPYKPGHVLTRDSRATKPLITVGEDGRATSTRESYIKAMNWWRENPRAQQYTAVKETGLPTSAMSETSSALRKNGEIPKVSNSGRAPIEEFGLLATAVKNLGLSVEKMLSEGTFEFIDSEGIDYYMAGLRDGMKSLRKFQQLAQQISNN